MSKLFKRVYLRAYQQFAATVNQLKAQQMLALTRVVAEAWNEWTRSQADATRRRQRKADGGGGATIAELVVETQHADPRYLEMVLKALADQRRLWGLDAPQKVDVRASRNPYVDMAEDELRAAIAQQAHLLHAVNDEAVAPPAATSTLVPAEEARDDSDVDA